MKYMNHSHLNWCILSYTLITLNTLVNVLCVDNCHGFSVIELLPQCANKDDIFRVHRSEHFLSVNK